MEGCVFCAIARGDIPAKLVYEDDLVVAFDDIAPQAPVHTLVIPREHYPRMGDVPISVLCATFAAVPKIAQIKGIAESGYRTIVNTGPDARQSVDHFHVHILGGAQMTEGMVDFEGGR